MSTIQKVIDESLKEFDEKFEAPIFANGTNHDDYSLEIKSHLSTTISNILSAIEVEVEGVQFKLNVDEYLPKVKMWDRGNYDIPFDDGYAQAKSDIQEILKSAKESIK